MRDERASGKEAIQADPHLIPFVVAEIGFVRSHRISEKSDPRLLVTMRGSCQIRTGEPPVFPYFKSGNNCSRSNYFSSFFSSSSVPIVNADVHPQCNVHLSHHLSPLSWLYPPLGLECLSQTQPRTPTPALPERGGRQGSHPRKGHEKQAPLRSHASL